MKHKVISMAILAAAGAVTGAAIITSATTASAVVPKPIKITVPAKPVAPVHRISIPPQPQPKVVKPQLAKSLPVVKPLAVKPVGPVAPVHRISIPAQPVR